jgi:hypothetical protein
MLNFTDLKIAFDSLYAVEIKKAKTRFDLKMLKSEL